jgi:hypothetical protein
MPLKNPYRTKEWVFSFWGGTRETRIERSTRERRRARFQIELPHGEIDGLREIPRSHLSELRMETA